MKSVNEIFGIQNKPIQELRTPERQSIEQTEQYSNKLVINTKEGTITKTPTNPHDIVNKEYVDAAVDVYLKNTGDIASGYYQWGTNMYIDCDSQLFNIDSQPVEKLNVGGNIYIGPTNGVTDRTIYVGEATQTDFEGTALIIAAGDTQEGDSTGSNGGNLNLQAGNGSMNGGNVFIKAGDGDHHGAAFSESGGSIYISSGTGVQNQGSITLTTPGGGTDEGSGNITLAPTDGDYQAYIILSNIKVYYDNADAVSEGLPVGALYRTGDILKIVHP